LVSPKFIHKIDHGFTKYLMAEAP